jgi:BirA family biotin operon repressor/biotin-[acetyl-CoA-carboxylase] ligase
LSLPDDVAAAVGAGGPALALFARRIHWYPTVSSTNLLALGLAEHGADEGVVVAAEAQTAGRGRQGRTWASPAGAGLYVSVILRPPPAATPLVTIAAGVALAEGIERATGLAPALKWPNDLYTGGRKLAGILAEAGTSPAGGVHVVLGFGINVRSAVLPPDVAARATSLETELGRAIDRALLFASCLGALAARYAELRGGGTAAIVAAWRVRAQPMLNRLVEWERDGVPTRGVAENIDESGALLVRTGAGLARVRSGEVRWMA